MYFLYYVYVSVDVGAYECSCPWRLEEGVTAPGARVTGSCEHLTWLLGIELGSSGGKVHALNH